MEGLGRTDPKRIGEKAENDIISKKILFIFQSSDNLVGLKIHQFFP